MTRTKSSDKNGSTKRQAKNAGVIAELKPKPTRAPKPAFLHELTETQLRVCELAADLLIEGGERNDIDVVLGGLLAHEYRRRFGFEEKHDLGAEEYAKGRHHTEVRNELLRDSRQRPLKLKRSEPPTTVAEMARHAARLSARSELNDFLEYAEAGELYFAWDIFSTRQCSGTSLAEAFDITINSDSTHIKVPDEHVDRVRDFLKLLEKDEAA